MWLGGGSGGKRRYFYLLAFAGLAEESGFFGVLSLTATDIFMK
jgi:hypothetical protein